MLEFDKSNFTFKAHVKTSANDFNTKAFHKKDISHRDMHRAHCPVKANLETFKRKGISFHKTRKEAVAEASFSKAALVS